jgi:hypothetical protein
VKKKKAPLRVRYGFADESYEELSLIELEAMHLREMHRLLSSDSPQLQEMGETKLKQIAQRLANERNHAVRSKAGSDIGAKRSRAIGDNKAKLVLRAIAAKTKPPAGERHVRRIKNRK